MRIPHEPLRPGWLCRCCGHPWPCGVARLALLDRHGEDVAGLCVYLAATMTAAAGDLIRLNAATAPGASVLWSRFLGWVDGRPARLRTAAGMTRSAAEPQERRRLRLVLRSFRMDSGLRQVQVTAAMNRSHPKIVRIEGGQVGISIADLRCLLNLYGVQEQDLIDRLLTLARQARARRRLVTVGSAAR